MTRGEIEAALTEALPPFIEKWRWFLRDGDAYHAAFAKDVAALARIEQAVREKEKT